MGGVEYTVIVVSISHTEIIYESFAKYGVMVESGYVKYKKSKRYLPIF